MLLRPLMSAPRWRVAVTLAAVISFALTVAADATASSVVHVPVTTAYYGKPIEVELRSDCGGACEAVVGYRETPVSGEADPAWTRVTLVGEQAEATGMRRFSGRIPGADVSTRGVDYYVEVLAGGKVDRQPAAGTSTPASYHVHTISPPLIGHLPSIYAVADKPMPVEMRTSCSTPSCTADVYFRTSPQTTSQADVQIGSDGAVAIAEDIRTWEHVRMERTAAQSIGDAGELQTWQAEVPGRVVDTRGVDYAFRVSDGRTEAWSPGTSYRGYVAADGQPAAAYHTHVVEPPRIVHVAPATAPYRQPIAVTGTSTCAPTRTCVARLWYRTTTGSVFQDQSSFETVPMAVVRVPTAGDLGAVTVTGQVPAAAVDTRGVDYFFSVSDGSTTAWYPGTSPVDGPVAIDGTRVAYQHIRVLEPPHIIPQAAPTAKQLQPYAVKAQVTCATEHCDADLFYTEQSASTAPFEPQRTFRRVSMHQVGQATAVAVGQVATFEGTVPAADVTTRGLAWFVRASDGHVQTFSPGTPYWGAYVPFGDRRPGSIRAFDPYPAQFSIGDFDAKQYGVPATTGAHGGIVDTGADLAWTTRVLEPPHVVHAPIATAAPDQRIPVDAFASCATSSCSGTLTWNGADGREHHAAMGGQKTAAVPAIDGLDGEDAWHFTATIPRDAVTDGTSLSYSVSVSDGYSSDTTPAYPVAVSDKGLASIGGRVYVAKAPAVWLASEAPQRAVEVSATPVVNGTALPGAAVTDTTDTDGRYVISNLAPGTYEIAVDAAGLQTGVDPAAQPLKHTVVVGRGERVRGNDFELCALDRDEDGLADIIEPHFGLPAGTSPDTDGDHLLDGFEARYAVPSAKPDDADSDDDGTTDDAEDPDHDGLDNRAEQQHHTDPLSSDGDRDRANDGDELNAGTDLKVADTDGDGLTDGTEIHGSTSPTDPDSDDDGVGDADETTTSMVTRANVTVELTGQGDLPGALHIDPVATGGGPVGAPALGQIGGTYEIHLDDAARAGFTQARITLHYDPLTTPGDPGNLRVFAYDEEHDAWMPSSTTQSVDAGDHSVTATVDHFSKYTIFDIANWRQKWQTTIDGCHHNPPNVDLAISFDVGYSTYHNDPQFSLGRSIAGAFVDALAQQDRGAIVEVDDSFRVVTPLTASKDTLHTGIGDLAYYHRPSDLDQIVMGGLSALQDGGPRELNRARMLLVLTDGIPDYRFDDWVLDHAKLGNVAVFPIGIGDPVGEDLLRHIAAETGGQYYHATSSTDVPEIAQRITRQDTHGDYDDDGVNDCDETDGTIDSASGQLFLSDPFDRDTDGDGLADGEELGDRASTNDITRWGTSLGAEAGVKPVRHVVSDPQRADTDGDGLDDDEEYLSNSSARSSDTDGDGASDNVERTLNTLPYAYDTDFDGLGDLEEDQRLDLGFDPLSPNEQVTKLDYAKDFFQGFTCGDLCSQDSLPWLMGNLASGFFAVGDVRDALVALGRGDLVSTTLSIAGLVPIAGDGEVAITRTLKFAEEHPEKADDVYEAIGGLEDLGTRVKARIIKELQTENGARYDRLKAAGLSDEAIIKLSRGRKRFEHLDYAISKADEVVTGEANWMSAWQQGEQRLRDAYGDVPQPLRNIPTYTNDAGKRPRRRIDAYDEATRTAHESKVGNQCLGQVRDEIQKDKWLRQNNRDVARVIWHFFPSESDTGHGRLGPCPALIDALKDAGIAVKIYLPS